MNCFCTNIIDNYVHYHRNIAQKVSFWEKRSNRLLEKNFLGLSVTAFSLHSLSLRSKLSVSTAQVQRMLVDAFQLYYPEQSLVSTRPPQEIQQFQDQGQIHC